MKALLYSLILTTLLFFNKIEANTDLIREAVENPHRKEEKDLWTLLRLKIQ